MSYSAGVAPLWTVVACLWSTATVFAQPPGAAEKIAAAVPTQPFVKPAQSRKLLLFTATRGFRHESIPTGVLALQMMGERTGAYEVVHSEAVSSFEPETLKHFDAVCMLNTTGELFLPLDLKDLPGAARTEAELRDERLKKALLDFVGGGKGLVGIHAATDCFYQWPAYGEVIGGYFDGHPWNSDTDVVIRIDDPQHPVAAPLEGRPLEFKEEIYQLRDPYARSRQRVLLTLDTSRTDMTRPGIKRKDGDFAVSWVKTHGQGRVFYCSLGHNHGMYWHPQVLRHYLAGIQFALGDLKCDTTPLAPPKGGASQPDAKPEKPKGGPRARNDWAPLFNGKDLAGWKGLVAPDGGPPARAKMTREELAKAQAAADEKMRAHWSVQDGVLAFDGQGDSIVTARDYGDVELTLEWKIAPGGDSGVYLRGCPQVQIWDAARWPEGSGGLYNNQHNPSKPLVRADRPVGEWNAFRIRMAGDRVDVWLNDVLVVDNTVLENHWERGKPLYPTGPIVLQAHKTPLWFRNIRVREPSSSEAAVLRGGSTWRELFNGRDLTGWQCKPGSWAVEEGVLTRKGGGDIWTDEQFGDFTLELEFKLAEQSNSGIFFRTGDLKDAVQTGIELQVLDSFGKAEVDKHDCGAIYDCLAPAKNAVKKPGEWNHVVLACRGPHITAVMNGERIIEMNLDEWTEPGKNPDRSPNKFKTAFKDMPRAGYIGFQDHGKPVCYRCVRIKPQ